MPRKRYALYATYSASVPDRDFTPEEQREFERGVAALSDDEQKAMVLLIYEHYLVENELEEVDDAALHLPYGGKTRREGASFVYDKMPLRLRWILAKFVRQRTSS